MIMNNCKYRQMSNVEAEKESVS